MTMDYSLPGVELQFYSNVVNDLDRGFLSLTARTGGEERSARAGIQAASRQGVGREVSGGECGEQGRGELVSSILSEMLNTVPNTAPTDAQRRAPVSRSRLTQQLIRSSLSVTTDATPSYYTRPMY